jgi:hypothetical protein
MRVRLKLKPGQRGTKKLTHKYGDRLVCVRYRYDEKSRKRYTTVELIVSETTWQPPAFKPDAIVLIKIGFKEKDLREKMKEVGGVWSNSRKMWKLPFKIARKLDLEDRIAAEFKDLSKK